MAAKGSLQAQDAYAAFVAQLRQAYQADKVFDGVFGAMMDVALVNDGPVTCAASCNIPYIRCPKAD